MDIALIIVVVVVVATRLLANAIGSSIDVAKRHGGAARSHDGVASMWWVVVR